MAKVINKNWQNKRESWMEQRFPDSRQATLGLRSIFVIPTIHSLALLAAIGLLSLMAINFQNSLIYGLSFWLIALIVISIFFTYKNLSGLRLKTVQSSPCFAGEKAVFELEVSCPEDQKKSAIMIGWQNQDTASINLQEHHNTHIKLSHSTQKRGLFKPSRLSIYSRYPTGLILGWSYASLDMHCIVYPAPLMQETSNGTQSANEELEQGAEIANGSADFSGIRDYQAGDSPKRIHWGSYAKTGKLHSKTFVDYATHDLWLEWDSLNIQGVEPKLSHLCAMVLQFHQEQQMFGMKIPGKTIQPGLGEAHKNSCLEALALFDMGGE